MIISGYNFVAVMIAELLWQLQNCDMIGSLQ